MAQRAHCGLHSHASAGESACCAELRLQERAGLIKILKNQPNVFVTEAKLRIIHDWLIKDLKTGEEYYADYKGAELPAWRKNRRLWKAYGDKALRVIKRKNDRFFVSEIIIPTYCGAASLDNRRTGDSN